LLTAAKVALQAQARLPRSEFAYPDPVTFFAPRSAETKFLLEQTEPWRDRLLQPPHLWCSGRIRRRSPSCPTGRRHHTTVPRAWIYTCRGGNALCAFG